MIHISIYIICHINLVREKILVHMININDQAYINYRNHGNRNDVCLVIDDGLCGDSGMVPEIRTAVSFSSVDELSRWQTDALSLTYSLDSHREARRLYNLPPSNNRSLTIRTQACKQEVPPGKDFTDDC